MPERFQQRLQREFDARREKNARFSLRAFAKLLGTEHATLSQILQGTRRPPVGRIRAWARQFGMDPEEAAAYIAAEHLPDEATAARQDQVRHWTAEAAAILMGCIHWKLLRLCGTAGFQSDVRWIAREAAATVDEVNVAFARLLRLGLLQTSPDGRWIATIKATTSGTFAE